LQYFQQHIFPSLEYIKHLLLFDEIIIEVNEYFPHQTNRNRCYILGPNGMQRLTVPIKQNHVKTPTGNIEIIDGKWKQQHWRSLTTAYNRSALFEFYKDELESIIFDKHQLLIELNTRILSFLLKAQKKTMAINFTTSFQSSYENDFRYISDEKSQNQISKIILPSYPQVFSGKTGFVSNLSAIDALFNGAL
jgi:hypothetical protein